MSLGFLQTMGTARPFQNSHARSRRPCFQPWRRLRNGGKRAEDELSPRSFRTKFGGLFLFLPMLASIPLDHILKQSGFPGSEMIPPGSRHAIAPGLKAVRDGTP